MKTSIFALLLMLTSIGADTFGQSRLSANSQSSTKPQATGSTSAEATRARVMGPNSSMPTPKGDNTNPSLLQAQAKLDNNQKKGRRSRSVTPVSEPPSASSPMLKEVAHNAQPESNKSLPLANIVPTSVASVPASSSQIYRVGVNDVLDIQLANNPGRQSTLYTVREGGMLEYPFAGSPINVGGMTTTEIANALRQRIKLFENPKVLVTVRDYASHTVNITGFVAAPGTKTLRREAMPLYTILAEALVLPEAARATITRAGRQPISVDLRDENASSTLIVSGDGIKVFGPAPVANDFFFVGGHINSPGQKAFHAGLTLTQAILASGGTNATAGSKVRISRLGTNGRLVSEFFNLKRIHDGRLPDPLVQKGDRIEVTAGN